MTEYKLTYFNGRGRAELIRLIFAAAGQSFIDERVHDWPAQKEHSPLGQLPFLTVGDEKLPQSVSIARFVAKRFHLIGSDDLEQAKSDAVVDTCMDLANAVLENVFHAANQEESKKKFINEIAPEYLNSIERIISLYGSSEGYSVGDSMKWSDLAVFTVTDEILLMNASILSGYPNIRSVRKNAEANPRIAQYINNRPMTNF